MSTQTPSQDPRPAGAEEHLENAIEQKDVAGLSQGQIVRRRFFRHRGAIVGLVVLGAVVLLAFLQVSSRTHL